MILHRYEAVQTGRLPNLQDAKIKADLGQICELLQPDWNALYLHENDNVFLVFGHFDVVDAQKLCVERTGLRFPSEIESAHARMRIALILEKLKNDNQSVAEPY